MTKFVSAKHAKHESEIDQDSEKDFSDFLSQLGKGVRPYRFRMQDYMESEWITIKTYCSDKGQVTIMDDNGTVWTEDWLSNFWFHCEYRPLRATPSHYAPVAPLSQKTDILMQMARNVGVPAWMILNNPLVNRLEVK